MLFGRNVQDSWAREIASQWLWESCSKEAGGEVRLCTSLQPRELALWTSKIRYQVKESSILCTGRCEPQWIHSFHMCCSYLGPTCSPCCLHSPRSLAVTMGEWQHLLGHSLGVLIHIWSLEVADGCDISYLLIWQEIFSSHRVNSKSPSHFLLVPLITTCQGEALSYSLARPPPNS